MLLLLDNTEDCLQGQCVVSFGQLLVKVRACVLYICWYTAIPKMVRAL